MMVAVVMLVAAEAAEPICSPKPLSADEVAARTKAVVAM